MTEYRTMDRICGSTFWDASLTWNTEDPDFTHCFMNTVLVWFPCAVMWTLCPLEIYLTKQSVERSLPRKLLIFPKLALMLFVSFLSIVDFGMTVYTGYHKTVQSVEYYTSVIKIVSLILAANCLLCNNIYGRRNSGPLFIFWFLLVICGAVQFRSTLRKDATQVEPTYFDTSYLIYYPVVCVICFLNFFAEGKPKKRDEKSPPDQTSPLEFCSFPSFLVFLPFDAIAWNGFRKPLEQSDLWPLKHEDTANSTAITFNQHWQKSSQIAASCEKIKLTLGKASGKLHLRYAEPDKLVSILPTLWKSCRGTVLAGGILKLVESIAVLLSPQILRWLIDFVSEDAPLWKGYLYAGLFFIVKAFGTLAATHHAAYMQLAGLRMRTAIIGAIYRKSLRISNSARKDSTVGEIVNLLSVDAQVFMVLSVFLHQLWAAPLDIAVCLYLLWITLGPSVFTGLGVMIFFIPLHALLSNRLLAYKTEQMKKKDSRVKLVNEILNGIRVLKLYAWECSFERQVTKIRDEEIKILKKHAICGATMSFIWTWAPTLVCLTSLATYVFSDNDNVLNAQVVFVSLTLFNIMQLPMITFPELIMHLIQGSVSLRRINKFMNAEELDPKNVHHDSNEVYPLVIRNGTFSWNPDKSVQPTLRNIDFHVVQNQLVAVVGSIGSGKTSLLSALLGEIDRLDGTVNTKVPIFQTFTLSYLKNCPFPGVAPIETFDRDVMRYNMHYISSQFDCTPFSTYSERSTLSMIIKQGTIAYVSQQAWIQNASVRDNILFGSPYDKKLYKRVIDGCALSQDLEVLPAGDRTEIGEKGINLSGGQKQRISLARAVYNGADVYLFDDPLSAVDAHVGKHIFDNVIGRNGMLKDKTRVIVTHGLSYLRDVDDIFVLKDGKVTERGTYNELLKQGGAFSELLVNYLQQDSTSEVGETEYQMESETVAKTLQRESSKSRGSLSEDCAESMLPNPNTLSPMRKRAGSGVRRANTVEALPSDCDGTEKFIEAENMETGVVKWKVYFHYARAIGWFIALTGITMRIAYETCNIGAHMWLTIWSVDNTTVIDGIADTSKLAMYIGVYATFTGGQAIFILLGLIAVFIGCLQSSKLLHDQLLYSILRVPIRFFDVTPSGRILNRFGKDMDIVDVLLPNILILWLFSITTVCGTIVVISYSTPIFTAVIIPMAILYYFLKCVYLASSRQLMRLESVSRSPIFSYSSETITGGSTIRAYRAQTRFISESEKRVDTNQVSAFSTIIADRWLVTRLEFMGNLIVFFAALFAVLQRDKLSAGLVGLSVTHALQVTGFLQWLVKSSSELESNIISVERIREYIEQSHEASWEIPDRIPAKEWPAEGRIEFLDYKLRYREGLNLALRGLTFTVKGGEKIGIVGRTGAGKSSMTLALFRIIEAAGGRILIDNVDVSKIGLHSLRSKLTIIPQDPVLFSGSLRMNLDPFDQYTDEEVWGALENARLKIFVQGLKGNLLHVIAEGGDDLSVGQRQLMCLARALLRKTKILILDEATASVDVETDDFIQQTIRKEFKDCTILTIAHRINTILDSDKVIVLESGRVAEFDSPNVLLRNKNGRFFSMANDAGLVSRDGFCMNNF